MSLNTGLEAFYKLSDPNDSVGSHNLTETGSPTYAAGLIDNAVVLSGSNFLFREDDDLFTLRKTAGDPDLGSSRTFAVWINADDFASQPGILSNWANSGGGPVQWLLFADDTTHLTFQVRDTSNVDHTARLSAPSTGAFHLIVCTYSSADGAIGISVDAGTVTSTTTASVREGIGSFDVGSRNTSGAGAGFNGLIDNVGVWTRVLSSTEITTLYASGAGLEFPFPADAVTTNPSLFDDCSSH